jgi:hypothetical protein
MGGTIAYPAMAAALAAGYATTSTDTGHVGNTAAFALGHPEKVIDVGYRAVHEMTVQAKAIINGYYNSAPKYSYFNGCSLGGRQGITEAQALSRRLRRHRRRRRRMGRHGSVRRCHHERISDAEDVRRVHPTREIPRDP